MKDFTVSNNQIHLVLSFLLIFTFFQPAEAGKIRVCAQSAEDNRVPIRNAIVECWDDDRWNNDDFMAKGMTGEDGCVTLSYKTKIDRWRCWKWWDSCVGKNPDIFCEVSGSCLHPTNTLTAKNHNQRKTAFLVARVPADADFCSPEDNWYWNGCGPGYLPDWLVDYLSDKTGFTEACNRHDVCFLNCRKTRQQCEDEFLEDMYEKCGGESLCEFVADLFSTATINLGEPYCFKSRSRCTLKQRDACKID